MSMPAENLHPMTLAALLDGIADAPAVPVSGITADSRKVTSGDLFLATAGATHHGLEFAAAAVGQGAAAVVYDSTTADQEPELAVPAIGVPGLGSRIGDIAGRFFGRPWADVGVLGVTGTNGKSTVAWLLAGALSKLDRKTAYSGTLGYGIGKFEVDDTMTSPDVVELDRRLADFRDQGARYAAIEVSSHALDQGRVDGIEFDTTLFTNLSRDHLDYHGDMRAYAEAKAKLFTDCPAVRRVVSLDSEFGIELAGRSEGEVVTVSTRPDSPAYGDATVRLEAAPEGAAGSRVTVRSAFGEASFMLPLPGEFNVANAGLVIACLCALGVELDDACAALASIEAPPGRMQRVPGEEPAVFVDYAHTPAALEAALTALRPHTHGALWCVFGCGGDRDAGKRPLMGGIAERLADRVVVTSDNPRGEPPVSILDDILAGFERPDAAVVIEDRAAAIAYAVAGADAGDVVLIAGKGHEDYQVVGSERLDFSVYLVALANLDERSRTEAT